MSDDVYVNAEFDAIGFMKHINRLMFEEEMVKLGIDPIKLSPLPKPETPLWMKYPKRSVYKNYRGCLECINPR